jgi:hypothetical protein
MYVRHFVCAEHPPAGTVHLVDSRHGKRGKEHESEDGSGAQRAQLLDSLLEFVHASDKCRHAVAAVLLPHLRRTRRIAGLFVRILVHGRLAAMHGHRQNEDEHEQPGNAPLMPQMRAAGHAALASVPASPRQQVSNVRSPGCILPFGDPSPGAPQIISSLLPPTRKPSLSPPGCGELLLSWTRRHPA